MFTEACLTSHYRLSSDELARLARTAPDQRWQAVRATQSMLGSDVPPDAAQPATGVVFDPVFVPQLYLYNGRSYRTPTTWQRGAVQTAVATGAAPAAPQSGASGSSGSSSRSGSGSSGSSSSSSSSGPNAGVVVVMVVAAAVIVFVLAGSEGARYDGWLGLPPDEPLYLDGADGSVTAVPLAALTPELAARATGATVYEGDTQRYLQLGRAPLDRAGFSIQSGAAFALVPQHLGSGASSSAAFGGRAFLGGFPVHQVGVGATADVVASTNGAVVANVGAEVQVMPVTPVGVYAGVGWTGFTAGDGSAGSGGWYLRGGVQGELPFTTRLTGSLRAGVMRADYGERIDAVVMPEVSVGLSVY